MGPIMLERLAIQSIRPKIGALALFWIPSFLIFCKQRNTTSQGMERDRSKRSNIEYEFKVTVGNSIQDTRHKR